MIEIIKLKYFFNVQYSQKMLVNNSTKVFYKLEIIFVNNCAPNHMLVHKDGALFFFFLKRAITPIIVSEFL